jgi:hypothetical protein
MIKVRADKTSLWRDIARAFALLLGVMLVAAPALAEGPQIGQINKASGTVSVVRGSARLPAKPGDPVYQSDVIETGADGNVGITFIDDSRFSIGPGGQLALQEFHFDTSTSRGGMTADLRQGTLAVVSGAITHTTPGAMHIKTPTSILGVRGTTFGVQVTGNPPKERFVVFPNAGGGSGAISIGTQPGGGSGRPP